MQGSVLRTLLVGISVCVVLQPVRLEASSRLQPSDHSILWPLKTSTDKDDFFQKSGDGFQNLIPLVKSAGERKSLIDEGIFSSVTKVAFNNDGGRCADNLALQDEMFFASLREQMNPAISLIQVRGLSLTICSPDAWFITSLRFDPCVNLASIGDPSKLKDECFVQLRLVAQPFEKDKLGQWVVSDFAMHLVYSFPMGSQAAIIRRLEQVADISRAVERSESWSEAPRDPGRTLSVHWALRNEMNLPFTQTKAAKSVHDFVHDMVSPDQLVLIATMGSSLAVKEWTFNVFENVDGEFKPVAKNDTLNDNFSDSALFSGQFPLNTDLLEGTKKSLAAQLDVLIKNVPAGRSALQDLSAVATVLHPGLTSQGGTNCVSCHIAPQIFGELERIHGVQANTLRIPGSFPALEWPGFKTSERSFINLRNFGYGPGFNRSINRRTINEAAMVQSLLETFN